MYLLVTHELWLKRIIDVARLFPKKQGRHREHMLGLEDAMHTLFREEAQDILDRIGTEIVGELRTRRLVIARCRHGLHRSSACARRGAELYVERFPGKVTIWNLGCVGRWWAREKVLWSTWSRVHALVVSMSMACALVGIRQ